MGKDQTLWEMDPAVLAGIDLQTLLKDKTQAF